MGRPSVPGPDALSIGARRPLACTCLALGSEAVSSLSCVAPGSGSAIAVARARREIRCLVPVVDGNYPKECVDARQPLELVGR
jgi:hypothetical protein